MRVLQSGLGEKYNDVNDVKEEKEESEGEEEESEEERSTREDTEGSPSGYNLRRGTPRQPDPSIIYSTPPKDQPALPRPRKNPPTALTVLRDSLYKDLSNQMHSILSGQGYTFPSDISAAARSMKVLNANARGGQGKKSVLAYVKECSGGMESPDVRVTRLHRDDERAVEFRESLRLW